MEHVAECVACSAFWHELQAAQALVLRLSKHRVGDRFREQLFERIETGEGTPPAVFQEPVPIAAKIRYTLTGAAAAAAVLVAATTLRWTNGTAGPEQPTMLASLDGDATKAAAADRAGATAPVTSRLANNSWVSSPAAEPLAPRTLPDSIFSTVRPLTPDLVAVETAHEFEQRFKWTTHLVERGQNDDAMARTVCANAAEIRSLGRVLVDLRDAKCVSFGDPEVDADLRVVVTLLDPERLTNDRAGREIVRSMVAPALRKSASLVRLTDSLSITPIFDRQAQQQTLLHVRSLPDVLNQIFFVLPSDGAAVDLDPREIGRMFMFQDACGPVYVAPLREVRRLRNR